MLLTLLQFFATKFLVLALHLEAGSFPKPLSAREEIETFAALRAGDRSAREKIIRHNLRLVAHVAKKYYAQPGDQEDLISIGTIGLMKAVDTFDTTRKARFATYASRCIENELRMHFRRERRNGLLVITGGPGTGKTTTINTIIRYFEMEGMDIFLAAPTGRAAKRMSETTGFEARTIHRMLELNGGMEGSAGFERNETNPLETDLVIIDEMSMVDITLMNSLLKAIAPGTFFA